MPRDAEARLFLTLMRFVGAGYETADAACWEEAHARAEAARGAVGGALLAARAACVVRALRRQQPGFQFFPPTCRCLSADESRLMDLVCACARSCERGPHDDAEAGLLLVAARHLAACAEGGMADAVGLLSGPPAAAGAPDSARLRC